MLVARARHGGSIGYEGATEGNGGSWDKWHLHISGRGSRRPLEENCAFAKVAQLGRRGEPSVALVRGKNASMSAKDSSFPVCE
jgi:hypothetical protein